MGEKNELSKHGPQQQEKKNLNQSEQPENVNLHPHASSSTPHPPTWAVNIRTFVKRQRQQK